jgi:RecB family exonuclease
MPTITLPVAVTRQVASGRDYLSFSAVSTLQRCSLQYFFRYVLGLPEETVSSSLVLGSAIHAALQYHFEQLLQGASPPSLDVLLDVFNDTWEARGGERAVFAKSEDRDSVGRLADRMLRAFQGSDLARPQGNVIAIEEELWGALIDGLPDLLARVDLVVDEDNCLRLTDFKTARSSWTQDHVEESASQLLLYHELARELADGRPIKTSFAVLTKTKTPDVAVYPVEVDQHQIERTKKIIERAWRVIQSGNFLPSPSPLHCPTCPFREPCRAWTG